MKIDKANLMGVICVVLSICGIALRKNISENNITYCMGWINSISLLVSWLAIIFLTFDKLKKGNKELDIIENRSCRYILLAEILIFLFLIVYAFLSIISRSSSEKNDYVSIISLGMALGNEFISSFIVEIFHFD